jgi:sirohydrochlorin ferrochelatase
MTFIMWIVAALLSAGVGVAVMRYLVVPPLEMSLYLAVALIMLFVLLVIVARRFSLARLAASIVVFLVFFAGGYLAANAQFLSQEEHRALPAITRSPGTGDHTAVVYFTHGEPPAYSYMPWIETFHELDADKAPFVPVPFRPFFFQGVRNYYLELGGSAHNKVHRAMLNSLEEAMADAKKQGTRFYLSFLDSNPRPDEAAITAVNDGARKIILTAVFLTESSHTLAGQNMVDDLHLNKYGVSVCTTAPLWKSDSLQELYVARANLHLGGTAKSKVGILLVGHGQPDGWDRIYPTQTEQENTFRQDVAKRFSANGFSPENIALAWMEFKEPGVDEKAQEMVRNGVEKILVIPASISADSIHSDIQIPKQVAKANIPASVEVINLGAWGDDPFVIEAIRQKIEACR